MRPLVSTSLTEMPHKSQHLFSVRGERDDHIGYIFLNNEHKFNKLNFDMVEDIERALISMEINPNIKFFLMTAEKQELFSIGTDFAGNFLSRTSRLG